MISRIQGYRGDHQKVYARIPSTLFNWLKSVTLALSSPSAIPQFKLRLAVVFLLVKLFECLNPTSVSILDKQFPVSLDFVFYFIIFIYQASLSFTRPNDLSFEVLYSSWPLSSVNYQSSFTATQTTHSVP